MGFVTSHVSYLREFLSRYRVNVLLFAIMIMAGCYIAQSSWYHSRLPEQNFSNLSMLVIGAAKPSATDTDITQSRASGLKFVSIDDKTYILTADHFCQYTASDASVRSRIIYSMQMTGEMKIASIEYDDEKSDICLLSVARESVSDIPIAKDYPNPGDRIVAMSAPGGFQVPGISLQYEGIFGGCDVDDRCAYTIPAFYGSSGSVVLDTRGRMVGLIQVIVTNANISGGSGLKTLHSFLSAASEHLGVRLIEGTS